MWSGNMGVSLRAIALGGACLKGNMNEAIRTVT